MVHKANQPTEAPIVYTAKQAAALLQVTPHTICAWARDEVLPGHRVGKRWRFTQADIEQYLAETQTRRPAPPGRGRLRGIR